MTVFALNPGRQLPKARTATASEDVAAEPPDEADDRWGGARVDRNSVAYRLWRFQVLI